MFIMNFIHFMTFQVVLLTLAIVIQAKPYQDDAIDDALDYIPPGMANRRMVFGKILQNVAQFLSDADYVGNNELL